MNWVVLIIAGLFEVGFAAYLIIAKEEAGNTAIAWYAGFLMCLVISRHLLIQAMYELPIGTAYAVRAGIRALGTALIEMLVFNDPVNFGRISFL